MAETKEDPADAKPKEKTNLGEFLQLGRYVGFVCLTYECLVISQVSNLIYMIYGGANANVVSCGDESFENMTHSERCAIYNNLNDTADCKYEADFHSVNYEFGYACSGTKTVKNSISLQMIGIMFGAIVFGQLSDTFGRRKTLIFGTIGLIISGTVSTFATGLYTFTLARFFVMFFTGGKHSVSYVFMMENLPARHRMWIVTVITYSPNYLVFTAIAYFCGEWRLTSRVVAAFTFVPLIMLMFIFESPRWLLNKGKFEEAREAMLGMGRWDHSNSPERTANLDRIISKEKERQVVPVGTQRKRYYTYHLFSTPALATYTVLFAYSLMTTSIISYGLVFNMEKLAGSPYLNTVIVGSLRYSINLVCAFVDIRFAWAGRRLLHGFSMGFISASLGLVFCIEVFGLNLPGLVRITALSAAAMGSQIYILNAVAPSELFPTPIRNVGIGFIQTWNRIGNIIAPQIFVVGDIWGPLPYLLMCGMSLLEVIAYEAFVPETKGKPLPEHMPDEIERDKDAEKAKLQADHEDIPLTDVPEK